MSTFKPMKTHDLKKNPFHMIADEWMLVTAKLNGACNTMTASWGAFGHMWGKDVAIFVLRPQRYTKEFVDGSDTLSLSFFGKTHRKDLAYLGKVSGRDEDKLSKCDLTITCDDTTPYFEEAETVVLCKKLFAQPMTADSFIAKEILGDHYPNKDYHTLYVAAIEKVLVKED